jgi:hypothetical protein
MSTSLARYHARAPRYVLDTEDNNLIRLSGAERLSWEEKTEIRDISLTGLSFLAPLDLSPQIGEVIKIQFAVPDSEQMACYAVVIRIEKLDQFNNLIGVHFYKLDRTQRLNLVQGLSDRIKHQVRQQRTDNGSKWNMIVAVTGLVLTLLCWLTLMKIYYLK